MLYFKAGASTSFYRAFLGIRLEVQEMETTIPDAVKQMLRIVKQLQSKYPNKRFTLDGRLVGDLGEILVENAYDVRLHEGLRKHHDGITPDGRQVQIKATMQNSLTFPVDHIPDYYLGIKINVDGTFREVFNGPGRIAGEAVKGRKPTKTNLHSVSISILERLNGKVLDRDRILRQAR
jgi:hypothetical protein